MDRSDNTGDATLYQQPSWENRNVDEPALIRGCQPQDDYIGDTSGWWIVPCVFLGALSWVGIFYFIFS